MHLIVVLVSPWLCPDEIGTQIWPRYCKDEFCTICFTKWSLHLKQSKSYSHADKLILTWMTENMTCWTSFYLPTSPLHVFSWWNSSIISRKATKKPKNSNQLKTARTILSVDSMPFFNSPCAIPDRTGNPPSWQIVFIVHEFFMHSWDNWSVQSIKRMWFFLSLCI